MDSNDDFVCIQTIFMQIDMCIFHLMNPDEPSIDFQTLMNVILAMNATVMPHAQIAQAAILASAIMASQETATMETVQV